MQHVSWGNEQSQLLLYNSMSKQMKKASGKAGTVLALILLGYFTLNKILLARDQGIIYGVSCFPVEFGTQIYQI